MIKLNTIKSYLALIILCFFLCLKTSAQVNNQVETISTEDGLSQGMIFDILQDQEGFMWIATKDGLNRYDGYEFKVFTNDPNDPWSISGNTIVRLFEDSEGRIWASSDNAGLNIYDKKTGRFHHIRHDPNDPSSLSGNNISAIVEDTSGYFITAIASEEINMFRLEDDFFNDQKVPQIIRIPMPSQESTSKITSTKLPTDYYNLRGIVKDTKNRIWVGGSNAIYRFNVQKTELTLAVDGYSFETASASPDGSIYAGGGSHDLFHWDGHNATSYNRDYINIRDIWEDKNENLWVATIDTLYGINLSGWSPENSYDLKFDHCFYRWKPKDKDFPFKSIVSDRSGIIWVGTAGFGLYKINPQHKAFSHHLSGISIRNIVLAEENELFLQNYAMEWFKEDGPYLAFNRLNDEEPNLESFLVSKSSEVWSRLEFVVQDYNKVKRYNPRTKETQLYDVSWHHNQFQPIIECQDGSIWMAGFNNVLAQLNPITAHIISYDLKNGKPLHIDEGKKAKPSEEFSTALYEDKDGILWVGTESGFTKSTRPSQKGSDLQVTHFENIPGNQNSLNYNHVSCFLEDPYNAERYLWVSTKGGGLNRLDKETGTFTHITKKDGLPDDVIYGILPDEEGNIWGSSNKGIFCMSQSNRGDKDAPRKFTFRNFSKADGLQENEFNTGAFAKLTDGRLAFGGVNGYNVFDPKEVLSVNFIPPTYLTNILVNNQQVSPDDASSILQNTIETTKQITLSHRDRILTLEFASLDFSAPNRNNYRYQLIGADDTWIEAGNRRSATFLNLQPNEYTFRVQGSNSQGIWSDHIAELKISILPPWWKTWWAYLIYIALIASGIGAYFRFSINRSRLQQQLAFEKREAGRVKELDSLKTQLYMNMTHEFRTPLTIILGMAKQVQENPKDHFSSGLNMIIRNGQNLLNLVNKMLNLSKLESGKMSLDLFQGDVVPFLSNIIESFRSFAANKEIQLHFLPEIDSLIMDFDGDKLQQVVSNLISNAFKFTPKGGHIYFNLRRENESLVIRVKDTGRGISQMDVEKVFDRFYQVDNSTTRRFEGSGIGLALSKELVILMEGSISVQSPPLGAKKGSEFMVFLPIGNQAQLEKTLPEIVIPSEDKMLAVQEKALTNGIKEIGSANNGVDAQHIDEPEIPLILITEDNEDVAAYVASCLPDYRLQIAKNGQEGFEMATEVIPDLIISDVMMPIMDGFEFCRKLKLDKRTDHIPVIMLTARADSDSKLEGLELGANVYLAKPFEKQELLLNIKNLFDLREKLRRHHQNIAGLVTNGEQEEKVSNESKAEDGFVIQVREFIENHLDDFDLNVEKLAKELHLSHSQFGRKLDALTGYSPNRFIRFIRLKKAKELLLDQDLSITSVAFDCGFNDPSYFTRVFKKEFGKTPLEWRVIGTS